MTPTLLIASTLLQAPAAGGNSWVSMLFMLGILVIFYFFMIRPQVQRQKKEKQFRENLKKDDRVVTLGGMYGRIVGLDEKTVTLEVADNVRIKFERVAVRELAK